MNPEHCVIEFLFYHIIKKKKKVQVQEISKLVLCLGIKFAKNL